jgi:acetyl esterase/lipase
MNPFRLIPLLLATSFATAAPTSHRDLPYTKSGHERHTLDLHLPEKSENPAPLIIWIHGGGWQGGSKENCQPLRQDWIQRGYAIASINYRLSSHAIFPAQIEDCKAAIRWLRANASTYHIDPSRFGVWGSSAGGHLAALVGTTGDMKSLDVGEHLDQSSRVQAVCDYFGPTDFKAFVTHPGYEKHASPTSPESLLLGGTVQEKPENATLANPITHVTPDDPPFLIVHGDQDPVVPHQQSELLYESLKTAGPSVHFHTILGAGHGNGFNGPEILPMVRSFFDLHLSAEKKPVAPSARTTNSKASTTPGRPQATDRQAPTFDQILTRFDTNQDGKITREEFRGPLPLFDRLDTNNDGTVTREEHQRLAHSPSPGNR